MTVPSWIAPVIPSPFHPVPRPNNFGGAGAEGKEHTGGPRMVAGHNEVCLNPAILCVPKSRPG